MVALEIVWEDNRETQLLHKLYFPVWILLSEEWLIHQFPCYKETFSPVAIEEGALIGKVWKLSFPDSLFPDEPLEIVQENSTK